MPLVLYLLALGVQDSGPGGPAGGWAPEEVRGIGSDRNLVGADGESPDEGAAGRGLPRLVLADEFPAPVGLAGPAPADPGAAVTIRLAPLYRWMRGHVRVRENAIEGTKLDFTRDLGLTRAAGAHLEAEVDQPRVRFLLELEEDFAWGGRTTQETIFWNGSRFIPQAQARDHAQLLTVRATVSGKWLRSDDGGSWLGPVAGVEYPFYTVTFTTNVTHGSLEDWVHYLPYPILGAAGQTPLARDVVAEARLTAGYLPNVPSPYIEGGRLYVSARPSIALEAPIAWRLTSSLELSFWISYQYWFGRDHSNEDGNSLTISSVGVLVGAGYRW
jgi:hypothetical protein